MNYITLIKVVFVVIKEVEELLPAGTSKDKLELAIAFIDEAFTGASATVPRLIQIISTAVAALNASGIFKKK